MIGYVVGPLVAALISLKYTDYRVKKQAKDIVAQQDNIAKIVAVMQKSDQEALKKTMVLVSPMSQAIKRLQQEVGIQ